MAKIPGVRFVPGRNDYKDGDGRKYGIAIHNTSNDASDEGEANWAKHRPDGVSSHLYVDGDSVTQSLDTEARAGHAGSRQGNENAISVEITGTNGKSRAWWLAHVAWDKLGRALAWLIVNDSGFKGFQVRRASVAEMRRNPKVRAFYSHDDMRRAWGGTTHTDPGPNFPWDKLFAAVNKGITDLKGKPSKPAPAPSAPAFPGRTFVYTNGRAVMHGEDIRRWQTQMRRRGWTIGVDGDYGPKSRDVAVAFQREKHLDLDGKVGPRTWAAAWTKPVT
ncbi:N-acetylmuramoyl-L-alanine amidase [Actinoplanes sp. NPDC026623]|uniref:peptidoglycan recognition protein family protein n=1 Tax=Actinoplanes sp. NPDC026623 TaxID=3155610 RepID=UPI0033CC1370